MEGKKSFHEVSGMLRRRFDQEGHVLSFLYRLSDLFLLNLLWIVFSLPVFTMAASTAALYTVTLKMQRNEESYIFRSYVHAFKENFRQGIAVWLLYSIVGGILYFNLYAAATDRLFAQVFFLTVFAVMAILYLFIGVYIPLVMAKFDTSILQILKISAYLSLRYLGYTMIILAGVGIPFVIVGTYLYLLPVLLIIGISGPAYINSGILKKIFKNHIEN